MVSGSGSYRVNKNTLLTDNGPPIFETMDGGYLIAYREYIGDVYSNVSNGVFQCAGLPINPSNSALFPWLNGIADRFQEYEIEGMIVEFKSDSADALNSTNTNLGRVIIATNYDPAQPIFTTPQAMEQYEYSTSGKTSECQFHPIECSRNSTLFNKLLVKGPNSTGDLRFFDHGNLQVATVGVQGSNIYLGELWVSYKIRLFKPCLPDASGDVTGAAHYFGIGPISGSVNMINTFVVDYDTIGLSANGLQTVVLPAIPGKYLINYTANTTAILTTTGSPTVQNCTIAHAYVNSAGVSDGLTYFANSTTNLFNQSWVLVVPSTGATPTFSLTFNGTSTSATFYDLYVIQVPDTLQIDRPLSDRVSELESLIAKLNQSREHPQLVVDEEKSFDFPPSPVTEVVSSSSSGFKPSFDPVLSSWQSNRRQFKGSGLTPGISRVKMLKG